MITNPFKSAALFQSYHKNLQEQITELLNQSSSTLQQK